jgi:hypothetical protein
MDELDDAEKNVFNQVGNIIEVTALQSANEIVAKAMLDYLILCIMDKTKIPMPNSDYLMQITNASIDKVLRADESPLFRVLMTSIIVKE